jgi:hypothetical protein
METILSILVLVFLFQLGKAQMEQRSKERERQLQALEKALANPSIDRATLQQLAQQLTGAKAPMQRGGVGLAWLLALGWLTLFTGAGIWMYGTLSPSEPDLDAAGVLVMVIGFGLVTYPFALREMESRRASQ